MNEKCKYPGCTEAAKKTWALVSLCHTHEKNIRSETEKYYWGLSSKAEYVQRPHYTKIAPLIPWSKLCMQRGDWA